VINQVCKQVKAPGCIKIKKFYLKSVHFITVQHKLSRAFQTDMHNKITYIKYSTIKHVMQYKINTFIQDSSAPVEKDSSAPRHFGTVEKKCQIGTAFFFKQT
jgi:hypothetical protein